MIQRKGIIFILSAPSGGGKSTIARNLIQNDPNLWLSVSVTTREKRQGEVEGINYYYIDKAEYENLLINNDLLESAQVYDNFYGVPKKTVFDRLAKGIDVIFDIDWQGARKLRKIKEFSAVSIFIFPPSFQELRRRLIQRGDSLENIDSRMKKAKEHCLHYDEYEYLLVNNDIDDSCEKVAAIIQAERIRLENQCSQIIQKYLEDN